ncbi:MAG: dihydroorotate dehydrogenase electron transfer subunit [Actinomycetota bacterium]|nr:dihydroorotate dehydrogenase electron transfer subunit [Actinomycetota bacterium]
MSRASQQRTAEDITPQLSAELVATSRAGEYHQLTFRAPEVAELAQPGQFVALAVGGDTSANLLRRCFSIHKVSPGGPGDESGTVDIVVAARGPGTRWLTDLRVHDEVSIIGPLGRGFPMPADSATCVLVGGGYGSAPLFWLAEVLRERGCEVRLVLGAATKDRLFGVDQSAEIESPAERGAGRATARVTITTDDGSLGVKGWVSAVLPDVVSSSGAQVVYGCGPMAMLRSVTDIAAAHGATAQVAVEESMACGIGVCMTCVMPVTGDDGLTRMARSCVEGPVFPGDQIRWEAFERGRCLVPEDALGAAAMKGH